MKWKIYNYLIDSKTQAWIANKLFKGLDLPDSTPVKERKRIKKNLRNKVSYYTRILEKEKLIEPLSAKAKPRIYKATSLSPIMSEKTKKDSPSMSEKSNWEFKPQIDCHHISYEYFVVSKPKRQIFWDKVKKLPNGCIDHWLHWPQDIGNITIRYRKGKQKDKVTIWLPSQKIDPTNWKDTEAVIKDYLNKASAWLQKLLLCKLGLPEVYRKPHFAYPVREPEIRQFLKSNTFSLNDKDDTHMDSSPPSLEPCFESNNIQKTAYYSMLPDKVMEIEDAIQGLEPQKIERIEKRLDKLEKTVDRLTDIVERLAEDVITIAETEVTKKPKEKESLDDEDKVMFG